MDLAEYLRVLREHWRLIALSTIACLAAAIAFAWTRTPLYTADTQFFVSTSTTDPSDIYTGGLFSQQRIQSYAQLVTSPTVLTRVNAELGLDYGAAKLASRIQTTVPEDTVLITVAVTDESPQRARDIARTLGKRFSAFVTELESLRGDSVSPVKVTITSPPEVPSAPSSPKKPVYLVLGALFGFILGVVLAVIRRASSTSRSEPLIVASVTERPRALVPGPAQNAVRSSRAHPGFQTSSGRVSMATELGEAVSAPVLGVVSEQNGRVFAVDETTPVRGDAYKLLHANLGSFALSRGLRSFVVTSAVESEGKTAVAAGLAVALSRAGYRVVLVDANLRKPMLSSALGLAEDVGLTELIAEQTTIETAIHALYEPELNTQLDIISSGKPPWDPLQLLRSDNLSSVIKDIQSRADLIILDAPALLPSDDAVLLSTATSGAILVAKTGTGLSEVAAATSSLRDADAAIIGVVLNDCSSSRWTQ